MKYNKTLYNICTINSVTPWDSFISFNSDVHFMLQENC